MRPTKPPSEADQPRARSIASEPPSRRTAVRRALASRAIRGARLDHAHNAGQFELIGRGGGGWHQSKLLSLLHAPLCAHQGVSLRSTGALRRSVDSRPTFQRFRSSTGRLRGGSTPPPHVCSTFGSIRAFFFDSQCMNEHSRNASYNLSSRYVGCNLSKTIYLTRDSLAGD